MSHRDVSGLWHGSYRYDGDSTPHRFTAELSDSGGLLAGVIEEPGDPFFAGPMSATLSGHRDGSAIRFTKIYDSHDQRLEPVIYEGRLTPDGDEIAGQWHITPYASGAFLMIRPQAAREPAAVATAAFDTVTADDQR